MPRANAIWLKRVTYFNSICTNTIANSTYLYTKSSTIPLVQMFDDIIMNAYLSYNYTSKEQ